MHKTIKLIIFVFLKDEKLFVKFFCDNSLTVFNKLLMVYFVRMFHHTMALALLRTAFNPACLLCLSLQRKTSSKCWKMITKYCDMLRPW